MRPTLRLFVILLLAIVLQMVYYYPRMPTLMATHFDGSGTPNGWMTRSLAIGFHVAFVALINGIFFGLPRLLRRIPTALINLPNKAYWMAPERKTESLRALETRFHWLGLMALSLMLTVWELVFRANLTADPRLPTAPLVALLIGFALFMIGWLMTLLRRFQRPLA